MTITVIILLIEFLFKTKAQIIKINISDYYWYRLEIIIRLPNVKENLVIFLNTFLPFSILNINNSLLLHENIKQNQTLFLDYKYPRAFSIKVI